MGRLILAIIAFILALAVLKMVIVAVVIAGLIFRTRETFGLLLLGGLLTLIATQPLIGFSLLAIIAVVAIKKSARKREPPEGEQPLLERAELDPDDPVQD